MVRSSLAWTPGGSSPDLVEEQRAAVGQFEQTRLGVGRAGERATHVAEQFALEQGLDDGRAVDHDEAPVRTRTELVQGTRDQFLAGAGLAADERRPHVRRHRAQHPEQLLHRHGSADHAVERDACGPFGRKQPYPAPQRIVEAIGQECAQLLDVDRLAQVVVHAEADGGDGRLHRGARGQEHQ